MDTLSETADKVDQSLQNMGIDGTSVKQSIRDFLNFKEYLAEQLPISGCHRQQPKRNFCGLGEISRSHGGDSYAGS